MIKKTAIIAATAMSLFGGQASAEEAGVETFNNESMTCTDMGNGTFHVNHESYDEPVMVVEGELDVFTNILSASADGGNRFSNVSIGSPLGELGLKTTDGNIHVNGDFIRAVGVGEGDEVNFLMDIPSSECSITRRMGSEITHRLSMNLIPSS